MATPEAVKPSGVRATEKLRPLVGERGIGQKPVGENPVAPKGVGSGKPAGVPAAQEVVPQPKVK